MTTRFAMGVPPSSGCPLALSSVHSRLMPCSVLPRPCRGGAGRGGAHTWAGGGRHLHALPCHAGGVCPPQQPQPSTPYHVVSEDAALAPKLAQPRHALEHKLHALPLVRAQPLRRSGAAAWGGRAA